MRMNYTPNEPPRTLTAAEIEKILPHRYPFALVDKILDYTPGQWARGIKCVTRTESFFQGHFPGHPVMPGVLILEALAQTGAVAALSLPENRGKIALFGGVKNARFRRQVVPGDVLTLECSAGRAARPGGHRQSHRLGGWCARGQRRADICYHGCLRAGFAWWIVL